MGLGDHVRISRAFLDVFKFPKRYIPNETGSDIEDISQLQADLKV